MVVFFLSIGVGCDDLFVFYDAFTTAQKEIPDTVPDYKYVRMESAFVHSFGAIMVTSLVTAAAFGTLYFAVWTPLAMMGAFASVVILADWIFSCCVYPCILGFYDKNLKHLKNKCPCALGCAPVPKENDWTVSEAIAYNKKRYLLAHGGVAPKGAESPKAIRKGNVEGQHNAAETTVAVEGEHSATPIRAAGDGNGDITANGNGNGYSHAAQKSNSNSNSNSLRRGVSEHDFAAGLSEADRGLDDVLDQTNKAGDEALYDNNGDEVVPEDMSLTESKLFVSFYFFMKKMAIPIGAATAHGEEHAQAADEHAGGDEGKRKSVLVKSQGTKENAGGDAAPKSAAEQRALLDQGAAEQTRACASGTHVRKLYVVPCVLIVAMLSWALFNMYFLLQITPPRKPFGLLPDNHMFTIFGDMSKANFPNADVTDYSTLYLTWGVKGIDRRGYDRWYPAENRGKTIYDSDFGLKLYNGKVLQHLVNACETIEKLGCDTGSCKDSDFSKAVLPGMYKCPVREFLDFHGASLDDAAANYFTRVPALSTQEKFVGQFSTYFRADNVPSAVWSGSPNWKLNIGKVNSELKFVMMEYKANINYFNADFDNRKALYNHFNKTIESMINTNYPSTIGRAWQVTMGTPNDPWGPWERTESEEAFIKLFYNNIVGTIPIILTVLLLTTMNWILTVISATTIMLIMNRKKAL